eukprot:6356651-Prymnesium_polylepis.1
MKSSFMIGHNAFHCGPPSAASANSGSVSGGIEQAGPGANPAMAVAAHSDPLIAAFFDSLSDAQRQQLADMKDMAEEERAAFGNYLVSASVKH